MIEENNSEEKEFPKVDFFELVIQIWSFRLVIFRITSSVTLIALIIALLLDNWYKATVTMLPQNTESGPSKFAGIAALAGVDLVSSGGSNEAFYEDVLKSDRILNELIRKKWSLSEGDTAVFLHDFLEIDIIDSHPKPLEMQKFDLKDFLRKKVISFLTDEDNGLMKLSVSIPGDPMLASDVANWLAKELHLFNESYREKKALENLETVKKQLSNAKSELTTAENSLADFQRSNKNYLQSAELQLKFARMQREVMTENAVYTELRKQYELAKIDYENSKESITILDNATAPVEKSKPSRALICILGVFLGFLSSLVYVFARNWYFEKRNLYNE